ncbi:MAG: sugar transferase [Alphaproteobacteria bacterium]|nr:sugar transferase [Alphaproteobacteria bacterium]
MLKRAFDVFMAMIGLVVLSPVMLVVALMVASKLGRPVFFRQRRPGLDGKCFELIKFRTMLDAYDDQGDPLPDEQRLPPFGRWLRATSLDELPELINVLRGELSLVGPRPLLESYLPHYTEEQRRRHDVRPGLTGWAQINGRNNTPWKERFQLDVWYVDNQSFRLDLKILLQTIGKVMRQEDIAAEGHVTMPRFDQAASSDRKAA